MPYLLALVAFAAVFAVYSTIVTVAVEALHKVFKLRSAGMSEMLRAFYDRTLASLQPADVPAEELAPVGVNGKRASKQSRAFVRAMAQRDGAESLRPWYVRNWPFMRRLFGASAERMSTLQFIEQLARTPQGAALGKHDRKELQGVLTAAAYEFERLGERQSDYYRARAKALSMLAGLCVAVFVNLDAIALYKDLAGNNDLTARLTTLASSPQLAQLQISQADAPESADSAAAVNQFVAMSTDLKSMGLPVGRAMFPHCEGYIPDEAAKQKGFKGGFRDPRCAEPDQIKNVNPVWGQTYWEFRDETAPPAQAFAARPLDEAALWLQYVAGRAAAIGGNPETFAMWAIGVFMAGGLLGLGAPFWFNLFGRGAAVVAPAAKAALAGASSGSPVSRSGAAVRRSDAYDAADLERGFLLALGRGAQLLRNGADPLRAPPPAQEFGARPAELTQNPGAAG